MARDVARLVREFDGSVDEGHPGDPAGPTSAVRAGSTTTAHPGTLMNTRLAWVELIVPTDGVLNANITCYHNFNLTLLTAGEPNVRWRLAGWRHNGTGAGVGTAVSVGYIDGIIAANSIQLRVYANTLTVDAPNPLRVCIQLIPAERWL